MSVAEVCVKCGLSRGSHMDRFGQSCSSAGFMLIDSHALDDIPPARRALERARLAQENHDRRMDVQLRLGLSR